MDAIRFYRQTLENQINYLLEKRFQYRQDLTNGGFRLFDVAIAAKSTDLLDLINLIREMEKAPGRME